MKDLTGQVFNIYTVIKYSHTNKNRHSVWLCECNICGKEVVIEDCRIKRGILGCVHCSKITHGHTLRGSRSITYNTWNAMIGRCTYPKNIRYEYYGGRGIKVCDRWRNSFSAFLEDMGQRPLGTSIDRIDVDGHYEPGNCRWADPIEQAANKQNPIKKAA